METYPLATAKYLTKIHGMSIVENTLNGKIIQYLYEEVLQYFN